MESQPSNAALNWELHFLIAKFLQGGPCTEAANVLIQEVERHGIIPKRTDWLGQATSQDFRSFSAKYEHIKPDHLVRLLQQFLDQHRNQDQNGSISAPRSLLSSILKVFPTKNVGWNHPTSKSTPRTKHCALVQRELFGVPLTHAVHDSSFFSRLQIQSSSLGHLTAVYCVLFDITGNFIFTGADDHLVKIWSARDGRLLASLRGNSAEITDLAVNKENTLLASSSCDRYIRIWCLATGAPVATLSGHSSNVTSIFFCPIPRTRSQVRYLASTSTDGSVAFWAYTDEPGKEPHFQPKPTIYMERMRPGHAQMICSSFSPGGTFMAAGSADNNVRVYHMLEPDGPKRILEVQPHTERVDSISWAHRGLRFISGSKDGTALVWRYDFGDNWRFTRIQSWKAAPGEAAVVMDPKLRPRVTMIGWNADDSLVLTAVSNHLVKVWNPDNGQLVRILRDHTDEVYVIEPHPIYPRVVCTAGHDGQMFVWDIGVVGEGDTKSGKRVFEYKNVLEEAQGLGSVFDVKWAPDGLSLAATDSHGHLLFFSCTHNDKFQRLPKELFFHTDYRPLSTDAINNTVLDEQTQVMPHLMPPPFLVNMDGAPYPAALQRLVPGRENCKEEQLIPNVAFAPGGQAEVIEGLPGPINARSNIDAMIAQLAAEQGVNDQQERRENMPPDRRGIGNRRSGDIEGVRQSRGNWQTGGLGGGQRRIVEPLSPALLKRSEDIRGALGEEEEAMYQERKTKKYTSPTATALPLISPTDSISSQEIKSRRLRRLAAQAAERRRQEELERHNEEEGIPNPNPPQQEISLPQIVSRRRERNFARRSGVGRRLGGADNGGPVRRRPTFAMRRDSEPENGHSSAQSGDSSFSSSDVSEASSSESEFTDSDWGGGGVGPKPSTSSPRKNESRKRRRGNESGSSKEKENSDEDYAEPKPGPSQVKVKQEPKCRPSRQQRKVVDESQLLDGISPLFRPSEWFGAQKPCVFPYWPQIGDDLIYFRQGHERYIKTIQSENVYPLDKKTLKSLPWITHPAMDPQVPCRVLSVKFEINPPRLACLKLGVVDADGELTGNHINVTYHDMKDVVDFLILKQLYDKSMRHNWSVNDRFRCLIGNVWWLGTIIAVQPHSPHFPTSKFLLYKVRWDNDDLEVLSPWDIEVIPDAFEIPEDAKENGICATEEDVRSGLYEVSARDWPPYGHQEAECDRISAGIGEVMSLSIAEAFLTPVDLNAYPDYTYSVAYPMDLSTIKARLDNRFYRRIEALKFDIKFIPINTETFNVSRSDIVKKSRIIRDLCLRICGNVDIDVSAEYHSLQRQFHWASTDIDEEERRRKGRQRAQAAKQDTQPTDTSARASTRLRERQKTERGRGRVRVEDESGRPWEDRCRDLLNTLWECRDSAPFREPVDPTEYPDYYQQIDTPMDLQSIKEDLLGGNYDTPLQFSKDVQLIFSNSKQYNTDKHSQIHVMTLRLKSTFDCQMRPILEDWKRNKSRRPKSGRRKGPNGPLVSPRKNPTRTAASRNPYVHKDASSPEPPAESSSSEQFVADEETYRDRRKRRRRCTKDVPDPSPPQPSTSHGTGRRGSGARKDTPPVLVKEESVEEASSSESEVSEAEECNGSRGRVSGDKESRGGTRRNSAVECLPSRRLSRRRPPSTVPNGNCAPSSPRKNPRRSAARRNPYVNHTNSSQEEPESKGSSEEEFVPVREVDAVPGRPRKRRRISFNSSPLQSQSSVHRRDRNGTHSSPEPVRRSSRIRLPNKRRISSDDEDSGEDEERGPKTRFRGRPSKNYEEEESTGDSDCS